jgi:hypothetical protein
MLVGHGSWEPELTEPMVTIPLGSTITFLCGPGGFLSGGVTETVVNCMLTKSDLNGVLGSIIPIGVLPHVWGSGEPEASYNPDKKVPKKASKFPKTVSSDKRGEQRRIHDYTLASMEESAYLMTFIDGKGKGKQEYTESMKISQIFGDCADRNLLPAQFIWVACRDLTWACNPPPKYAEIAWVTRDEFKLLTEAESTD